VYKFFWATLYLEMRAETSVGVCVTFVFCLAVLTEIRSLAKVPIIKFHESPIGKSRVFTDRQIFGS